MRSNTGTSRTSPSSATRTFPPGPKTSFLSTFTYRPGRDPLQFFSNLAREYGDLAYLRMGGEHLFIASDPAVIRDVLVTHNKNFHKSRGLERIKILLGEGLLTSEDAVHLRQRRLMQPAFHRDRVAAYASTMVSYADRVRSGWSEGTTLDVAREMSRLTLLIVGKTLFDTDVESQARDVGDAMSGLMNSFWTLMLPFGDTLERLPIPRLRRGRKARERLDAIIYGIIAERRASGGDRGDLLSMLLMAQDDQDKGRGMTDRQVRDEAMTIFLAGHETTANALTWTWYLLSQSPDIERRLHEEIDRVLAGRLPTVADVDRLPYTTRVVTESMRLYPPAWLVGRRAVNEYSIGGYSVPPRSIVVMSQWIVHRDPRHYPEPERFDPDRWTPAFKAALPRFAYFPFGGGPRQCIGESFAWMELVLVLATIAQRWRFDLVPGHPVVPHAAVTLRPKYGMKMTARARFVVGG
jgi:cytochrome P450